MEPSQLVEPVVQEEEEREPCPTPLSWQQVLDSFRNESDDWQVSRGDKTLHGRSWGEGPPLYFLNGFYGSCELFALTAYLLREEYTCVLFDYSSSPEQTLADYAESLLAIADGLEHDSFSIFATSFGTAIALEAMSQHPGRVKRAALHAAISFVRLSLWERLGISVGRCLNWQLGRLPGWETVEQANHRRWFPPFDQSRWGYFLDDSGETRLSEVARRVAAVRQAGFKTALAQISQPVFIVRTEGEGSLRSQAQDELQRSLQNCCMEELTTCGRIPFLTHPHRLAKLLRPFLEGGGLPPILVDNQEVQRG